MNGTAAPPDRRTDGTVATGPARRLLDFVTFRNMPVRRKFTYFTAGVSLWYLVIGGVGILYQPGWAGIVAIGVALGIAHVLLILFAVTAARSFTVPIHQINRQIREITSGELTHLAPIKVIARDEVGELTLRFNGLLGALRELQTFRKVIEQDDTTEQVFRRLARVFEENGMEAHQVLVLDEARRSLRPAFGEEPPRWCAAAVAESALLCRAFKTAGPVSSDAYPGICPLFDGRSGEHHCMPLILGGTTSGIVQIVHPRVEGEEAREVRTRVDHVRRYVHEALPVLEARRLTETLRESAMRDGLTRLYNRRFLEEMAVQVATLVRRRKGSLGVILCDVDHFKKVNDTHGHGVGDQVLREVAAVLTEAARSSDFVIRYGGEEFLLLLHDADVTGAFLVAERIRAAMERREIATVDLALHVTMSFGVAAFPGHGDTFADVVRMADQALYAAKAGGRNRVMAFDAGAAGSMPETS